jgi:hypothetical protein
VIARPQVWVAELAARFWDAAGEPPPFPRDLRAALCWLPNLHVVEVPNLTLRTAAEHFARHGVPSPTLAEERRLAGCFGGHRGTGVILIDSTLDLAELLFTLAHELAHYLREYEVPRRKAESRLGPRVLEVLDGLRPPTVNERLAGVLRGVAVGPHAHHLDRDRRGRIVSEDSAEAEAAADRLAYELLAPFDAVAALGLASRSELAGALVSRFGLPPAEAAKYAAVLAS